MGQGGSTKKEAGERGSDVASSEIRGVRIERETTPAPPGTDAMDEWAALPSARPTSVPDYDPDWPASVVAACRAGEILADRAAAQD